MPIEGVVAQVLNTREIAINVGSTAGVRAGMRFAVLAATPLDIVDPVTGKQLGAIDREKVRVEASEVFESYTICRTYERHIIPERGVNPFGGFLSVRDMLQMNYQPPREEVVTLRAQDSDLPAPIKPEESYVKIRDRVREIEDS